MEYQNPDTKDYIMVLQYVSGGNVNNYMIKNREFFNWKNIEWIKIIKIILNYETKREFDEAEEYRKANLSSVKNNPLTTHPQAIYTSRLLHSYTKDIPKYDVKFSDSSAIVQFLQHKLNESN
ncbi:unnamed protein product [Rhizophagus irregularis]|nr:unnamed protein product [Rhizophagus irregularis]